MTLMIKSWCAGDKCDPCNHPICAPVPLHMDQIYIGGPVTTFSVPLDATNLGGYGNKKCSPMCVFRLGQLMGGGSNDFGIPVQWTKWMQQPNWTGIPPGIAYPGIMAVTVTVDALGGPIWSISGTVIGEDIGTAWGGLLPTGQVVEAIIDGTPPSMTPGLQCVSVSAAAGMTDGSIPPSGSNALNCGVIVHFFPSYYA